MALLGVLGATVGANLIQSGAQAGLTGARNRKQREFVMKMYQQQVADRERFWQMQNEYNLPSNQMARLKAAGLNPNLVYGNGTATTAGDISAPSPQSYNPETPNLGSPVNDGLAAYNSTRLADAEVLLKRAAASSTLTGERKVAAEADILESLKAYKIAEGVAHAKTAMSESNIKHMENLVKTAVHEKGLDVHAAMADAMYTELRNAKVNVDKQAVESLIQNRDVQTKLMELENALRARGNSFSDPYVIRRLGEAVDAAIEKLRGFMH